MNSAKARNWLRTLMLGLSALLWLAASLCYLVRPDACAAATFLPPWVWALPGMLLVVIGWGRPRWRPLGCGALWILFVLAFAEEPRSLARRGPWPVPEWQAARQRGEALRVVSLNCCGRSAEAAAEVGRYDPDIVLLQESPKFKELKALARRLFGDQAEVVRGPDASIIARGRLYRSEVPPSVRTRLTQATVELPSGLEVEVMSVRLLSTPLRFDLWRRACWKEYQQNRRARRHQVRQIADQIELLPETMPVILGGDFNAPAGDPVFRLLKPRLHDTFREGGRGWGNTAIDRAPVSRIDQIWVSEHFRAAAVVARKARHSDHRMVVCDLMLRGK